MTEQRAKTLIQRIERAIIPLEKAVNLAHWEASTTGTAEAQEKATEAEAQLRKYLSSEDRYREIVETRDSGELADPLLHRQLELLALEHKPNLLPEPVIDDLVRRANEIQTEFYTFRAELGGSEVTNNQILDVLRSERDERRRQAAWEASKQIAPRIATRLRDLIAKRNEAARSLGYRDFYAMRLELAEIDEGELLSIFEELREATNEPFRRAKAEVDVQLAKRYETRPESLRPWHYEDPFFQEPPLSNELRLAQYFRNRDLVAVADRFYRDIGLPVDDILDRSDLYERAGKDQHAYCTNIDREGDIRILCNLKSDDRWMGILLHELGHAVYEKYIPSKLPWVLRQPAHIASTEAIAMFMDRLAYDIDWLENAAGIESDDRDDLNARTERALQFEMLLTARWVLVMTYFERALYADPNRGDLDEYWWDLVEELQLVPRPEGRQAPDWAAKIHLTVAPVYYHNYLLGELIASQLGRAIRDEILAGSPPAGYVGREELGTFLRERLFEHGASQRWQDALHTATGARLSPMAFLDDFVPTA